MSVARNMVMAVWIPVTVACSGSGTTNSQIPGGGTRSTGGSSPAGGALQSGGTVTAGGAATGGAATGGATSLGGTGASAGTVANGGTVAGGEVSSSAGIASTAGGNPTGGTSSPGGAANAGQSPMGGASSAGTAATGGSTVASVCGDGVVTGTEGCESLPKNNDLGDGCSPTCTLEPMCPPGGGACVTRCGDGFVLDPEQCDDGNAVSGDGCSASCQTEPGYSCTIAPLGSSLAVPMVVRDFDAGGDFEKGATFATNLNYANQEFVQSTLDARGMKPVLVSTTGTYNGVPGKDSGFASAESFAQLYDDAAVGPNKYHATLATTLSLFLDAAGTAYANRYGVLGDGLTSGQYQRTVTEQCGSVAQSKKDENGTAIPCTVCYYDPVPATPQCDVPAGQTDNNMTRCQKDPTFISCSQNGTQWIGTFLQATFDGNPTFFPADAITPANPSVTAQITGNYDTSWPVDPSGKLHNFSFTTEVRTWFKYDASKAYRVSFTGDDDVWVFVNKHLAIDLGGIHTAVHGALTIDSGTGAVTTAITPTNVPSGSTITTHPDLGTFESGRLYEIAVFHVERQTKASSYYLSMNTFAATRSVCTRQ